MDNKKINFYYQNVRGLRSKTLDFSNNLLSVEFDIILLTETWLNSSILDSELVNSGFTIFRRDRGSHGGGVMILISERLGARPRLDCQWDQLDVECLWITIEGRTINSDKNLHIALAYMPPGDKLAQRINKLTEWFSEIVSQAPDDYYMLAGDFNLPCIQWNDTGAVYLRKGSIELQNASQNFINACNFIGLHQYNLFTNSSGNTLDLVFTNFYIDVGKCTTPLVPEDTHHITLSIDASDITVAPLVKTPRKKYLYRKANYSEINTALSDIDWSDLHSGTVDDCVFKFYNKINSIINKFIPLAVVDGSSGYPVWFTKALININKEKNRVHSRWKAHKNPLDYDEFSLLRSRFKRVEAQAYNNYISRSQEAIKSNPKLLWSYIKAKRKSATGYPSFMSYGNAKIDNTSDIVQAFNCFFQQMFVQPSGQYTAVSSHSAIPCSQVISTIVINETSVLKLLRNLDSNKGPGSDAISPYFFIKCAESLCKPVTTIFNRSIREGFFPSLWKQAHIVPLHKKGSKSCIEHYRPISILNVLSKCLEKIVYESIYPIIAQSLPEEQHGFARGRSTTTNLGVFISDVLKGMEMSAQVDVIYTDFEKAFDRVDHVILLRKLQGLGIQGDLLRWVQSYIENRHQAVVIGGTRSDFISIPSGVPQGSLLGPLFYSAYLYDINSCFHYANFLLFADDKKVYYQIRNAEDCLKLQSDLDRLSDYYNINRIGVNVDKCMSLIFTRSRCPISYPYTLNKAIIRKENNVRDLGILLDRKLTFSSHIEHIVDRAYKNLGFILRVTKNFTSIPCLKVLYYAYVRSVLEYCSPVWNPQYITYEHAIESIQKKFVKQLDYRSKSHFDNYNNSCQRHGLMSLRNRRIITDMCLLHDTCSGTLDCPKLISSVLTLRAPTSRTRHTQLFNVPSHRTNYSANSLTSRMPRTYNKLFNEIDPFVTSKISFKTALIRSLNDHS